MMTSWFPENLGQRIWVGILVAFIVGNVTFYGVEFRIQVKEKESLDLKLKICNDKNYHEVHQAFPKECLETRKMFDKMNPWIDAAVTVINHNFETVFMVVAFILNSWPVTIITFTVCALFLYNLIKKMHKSRKDSRNRRQFLQQEEELRRIREMNLIEENTIYHDIKPTGQIQTITPRRVHDNQFLPMTMSM